MQMKIRNGLILSACAALFVLVAAAVPAHQQDGQDEQPHPAKHVPTLTVTGDGEIEVDPDRAVVRLGAVVQAEEASSAQAEVNEIMTRAIDAIKDLGIAENQIQTSGLSVSPVYSGRGPVRPGDEPQEPRIVGFRASNTVRVQIDDLTKIGAVIDAGVGSGANNIEGISFEVKDDLRARTEALRRAVREARAKADAIAGAMGMTLDGVRDVAEGGVSIVRPEMMAGQARFAAADVGAPVQPGQITINASVTITYRIAEPE